MLKIKNIIERNFSSVLLLGALAGFFVPGFGEGADKIVIILTAILIFISCSDIEPNDFFKTDIFNMGVFTLLRFMVLPLILFAVFQILFPEYAIGALLLALMPRWLLYAR